MEMRGQVMLTWRRDEMSRIECRQAWVLLAQELMNTHGIYFTASLLCENDIPIEFALLALSSEAADRKTTQDLMIPRKRASPAP
jgi:hypothetical protein